MEMIYDTHEARQIDEWAKTSGLPLEVLMERAGSEIAKQIKEHHDADERILIVCGTGNNGGDGYVIGRELIRDGYDITLHAPFGEPKTATARLHTRYAEKFGLVAEGICGQYDVIVDAVFGTGFDGARFTKSVTDLFAWVQEQQQQGARLYAVDIPSGIPTDQTSDFSGQGLKADATFCLHAFKRSAFLVKTAPFFGQLKKIDLGLPAFGGWSLYDESIEPLLTRNPYGHKGTYGTGLLIGGSETMPGSIQLATRAALRTGIGKLQVATVPSAQLGLIINAPEAMILDQTTETIQGIVTQVDVAGIGPGLSSEFTSEWIDLLLRQDIPVVLDASALIRDSYPERQAAIVVTPHIGEFARMTNQTVAEVQDDLFEQASAYAMLHQVIVVLKSHVILIAKPDGGGYVIAGASSGLAKGGSGDTLFGLITSLLGQRKHYQHFSIERLIAMGVSWYAQASKQVEQRMHPSSIVATDLIEQLGKVEG
ncbi:MULTISPECIES: bifunctional ADP-dependent NAD(P)H-hydrate dehydratase/NAD(P)H-hydrate epimerase [Exiguobacterium]|uniref:bifunctional ADP-dependent NAD(P)H-hydrate dehydratase/NAD(P)H-hydrate epimerase n=1 Tax=Exiguobacterium TaxID=33986 RepID=UPI000690072F|nr:MULTISPECIES: bifunctional ADP-dependent NAD(P)H-hydrate dehydratase/NAD(P)H-hydrate epimerase [Exiguobacterium]MCT4780571.1 bifunctional ADP-dependent NAD(P)H-hydrate dehydratase/NAD(P)H-hydrate epimerase [Exiguobacterium soli]